MKATLFLQCIFLVVAFATAALILPGENLSPRCQTPKCPELKKPGDEERVVALPYPLDCLQYVECKGTESRILPCPPDEVFDKNTRTCGPQSRIHCVPCYQEAP